MLRIIRALIDIQNRFHLADKLGTLLGWNYPADPLVRFKFVFFNTWRTLSYEMLST